MLKLVVPTLFIATTLSAPSFGANEPEKIAFLNSYKTQEPKEYKNDEHASVTIEGAMPLTCLTLTTPEIFVDPSRARIDIKPRAIYQSVRCEETRESWRQAVDLGILPAGLYMLVVGINGQPQILTIRPRT